MPQLDKFTFLDQTLSVIFCLLVLYLLNVYVFLPKVIYILKLRGRFFKRLKLRQKKLTFLLNFVKQQNILILKMTISNWNLFFKVFIDNYKEYLLLLKYTVNKYLTISKE